MNILAVKTVWGPDGRPRSWVKVADPYGNEVWLLSHTADEAEAEQDLWVRGQHPDQRPPG